MLVLETSIQRVTKMESASFTINDLLSILPGVGRKLGEDHARQILARFQDQAVDEILAGRAELVCERCDVVHRGTATLLRRGTADRRTACIAFRGTPVHRRQAHTMLTDALPNVLFDVPSAERTTSVIEREMRELNRRTDVGVRWSVPGVANILRLRRARRINQDDFERGWSPVRTTAIHVVPLA